MEIEHCSSAGVLRACLHHVRSVSKSRRHQDPAVEGPSSVPLSRSRKRNSMLFPTSRAPDQGRGTGVFDLPSHDLPQMSCTFTSSLSHHLNYIHGSPSEVSLDNLSMHARLCIISTSKVCKQPSDSQSVSVAGLDTKISSSPQRRLPQRAILKCPDYSRLTAAAGRTSSNHRQGSESLCAETQFMTTRRCTPHARCRSCCTSSTLSNHEHTSALC